MTDHPIIHPATPRKLKTEFKRAGYKYHRLAKARGINVKYIHDLITKGKEPSNPNIRQKLFLPKKPRAPYGSKKMTYVEPTEEIKWWRALPKDRRHEYIRLSYQMRSYE